MYNNLQPLFVCCVKTAQFNKKEDVFPYAELKYIHVNLNQSHYRPEVPRVFQEVKVPRLRDNGPGWW